MNRVPSRKSSVSPVRAKKNPGPATGNGYTKKVITGSRTKEAIKAGRFRVTVTNRSKVYWPEEGYTKGELLAYYQSIAPVILPHLKDRPLSLKRNPNGITDPGFYHKDAGENTPPWVSVFPVRSGSNDKIIDYIVCNNEATLLYVVNLGCIEINPWNSTTAKKDNPTWMVIDIDPSAKNSFAEVIDVALATREVLNRAGAESFCKTSGSSGLHVYVPLGNKYKYDEMKAFAYIIASLVHEQVPGTTSLERTLSKRGDKIYIDYLQNRIGQTLASVYSIRPVPGAWASTPLEWKEVKPGLHPSQFTMKNIPQRIRKKSDLFLPVIKKGISLQNALKKLDR
jgi:bifunctional non-homologous end joining protein LigD